MTKKNRQQIFSPNVFFPLLSSRPIALYVNEKRFRFILGRGLREAEISRRDVPAGFHGGRI